MYLYLICLLNTFFTDNEISFTLLYINLIIVLLQILAVNDNYPQLFEEIGISKLRGDLLSISENI
jgi:hypothetical protein